MKIDYTINELQASILALLQEREPLTLAQLIVLTGASKPGLHRDQFDLRMREFATAERFGHHKTIQLSITAHGTIALNAYRKKWEILKNQPVAPTRINLMAQPVWVPPSTGYCRNDGNGHIPSLGATA